MPTTTPQKENKSERCLNEGTASSGEDSFVSRIKTPPKQEAYYRFATKDELESGKYVPREISSFHILLNGLLICGIVIFLQYLVLRCTGAVKKQNICSFLLKCTLILLAICIISVIFFHDKTIRFVEKKLR